MIETQLDDLIGAVRALGDTMDEIRLDIARMADIGLQVSAGTGATPPPTAPPVEPVSNTDTEAVEGEDHSGSGESAAVSVAVSRDDVVEALQALDAKEGKAAVKKVLASFEARNLTTLAEEKYAGVVEAARAAA